MIQVFAPCEQTLSGQCRNNKVFAEAPAGSDGGTAGASKIVAIGAGDAFDDAEVAQASELPGEGSGSTLAKHWQEVGAAEAGDAGRCRAASRFCSGRLKKLSPRTLRPLMARGWVRRWSARIPAEKSSRLERYSR